MVLRRLLWALTSILLVVALVALPVVGEAEDDVAARNDPTRGQWVDDGGAGGDGGEGGDGGFGAGDGPTTTGEAPAATTAPGDGAGGEAAAAPTTTTEPAPPPTFPPPAEGLGAAVDPGAPVPPRPGTYRYRTTGGPDGDREATTTVEERSRAGDEVRLTTTTEGPQGGISSDVVWRRDGVRALRSTFRFGERSGECDWEPDVVEAVFPLAAGATWTSDSSCAMTGVGLTPITLRRRLAAEVVDLRRVQVAGAIVDVWAVRRTEQIEGGGFNARTTALALFSPRHGLDVEVSGTAEAFGERSEYRQELLALDPA